ncbi:MAG: hypothetical protein M1389_11835, partial [Chloroflexi bacterium]|nr:hypothetical protein [Chloroflexota bacterium]
MVKKYQTEASNSHLELVASYYSLVLSELRWAKEVRLFGLGGYFLKRLTGLQEEVNSARSRQEHRELMWQAMVSAVASLAVSGTLAVVLTEAVNGHATLGDVMLVLSAAASVQGSLSSIVVSLGLLS